MPIVHLDTPVLNKDMSFLMIMHIWHCSITGQFSGSSQCQLCNHRIQVAHLALWYYGPVFRELTMPVVHLDTPVSNNEMSFLMILHIGHCGITAQFSGIS